MAFKTLIMQIRMYSHRNSRKTSQSERRDQDEEVWSDRDHQPLDPTMKALNLEDTAPSLEGSASNPSATAASTTESDDGETFYEYHPRMTGKPYTC